MHSIGGPSPRGVRLLHKQNVGTRLASNHCTDTPTRRTAFDQLVLHTRQDFSRSNHNKQKTTTRHLFCEVKHGTSLDPRCCFGGCRRRKRPTSASRRNGDGRRRQPSSRRRAPTPGGDVQLHRLPGRLHPDPRRHERDVRLRPVRPFPVLRGVLLVPPLPQQLHPYHRCWHHHVPGLRVHRRPVLHGRGQHGNGGGHPRRRRHGIAHPVARRPRYP